MFAVVVFEQCRTSAAGSSEMAVKLTPSDYYVEQHQLTAMVFVMYIRRRICSGKKELMF